MDARPVMCDISVLHQKSIQFREQIKNDPGNSELRMGLAWCLFIQALLQAGRESLSIQESDVDGKCDAARSCQLFDQEAYQLLKGSLQQTFIVMQLSAHVQDRSEVSKLHALIQLYGANEAFDEAQAEAMRSFERLVHDIFTEVDQSSPL